MCTRCCKQGVDYVLLPNAVDAETPFMQTESKLCPWNQTLPFVVRAVEKLASDLHGRLLCPTIHFRQGPRHVREEVRVLASMLGRSKAASDAALEKAYRAQEKFSQAVRQAGVAALRVLRRRASPRLCCWADPTTFTTAWCVATFPASCERLYGINVVPLDFLPLDREDVSQINENMYWQSGRLILAAARIVRT